MSPSDPIEKREQPRIARRLPVRFGTARQMRGGVAVDISVGGLRVAAIDIFPVHTLLDLLVQFPGHAVRLRARVTWTGPSGEPGAGRAMGLVFTRPEPSLAGAYKKWLEEVKQAMAEPEPPAGPAGGSPAGDAPAPAPKPAVAEPSGQVKRRLESPQGRSYDILLEPLAAGGWRLTIIQIPRQLGDGVDYGGNYRDYASAEVAMREFVRAH
jgi:hypothetical protein